MITLRVARNFAETGMPFFNKNEAVAANTSLFWPVLLSPLFHFTSDWQAVLAVRIVSLLCYISVVGLCYFSLRDGLPSLLFLAIFSLLPSTHVYLSSGWENVPQMVLCTLGFLLAVGTLADKLPQRMRPNLALLSFSLAFLLRPDTAPIILPFVILIGSRFLSKRRIWDFVTLLLSASLLISYLIVHWHFYGTLVPNTASLKVDFGTQSLASGCAYLFRSSFRAGNTIILGSMLLAIVFRRRRLEHSETVCLAAIGLQLIYIIAVGGDVFGGGRFLLSVTPFALWLLCREIGECSFRLPAKCASVAERCSRNPLNAIPLTLVVLLLMTRYLLLPSMGGLRDLGDGRRMPGGAEMQQIAQAQKLTQFITPQDGRIGLARLGSLPYYFPEYSIMDFLGKADPVIAGLPKKYGPIGHNKWDFDYSLRDSQVSYIPYPGPPEWTQEYHQEKAAQQKPFAYMSELYFHPIIQTNYVYLPPEELVARSQLGCFIRRDLVEKVRAGIVSKGGRTTASTTTN